MFITIVDNNDDMYMINSRDLSVISCTDQESTDDIKVNFEMVDRKYFTLCLSEEEWSHVQDQVNKL